MTTFVTSFINVNNNEEKTIHWRIDKFMELVRSGIQLCVYIDSSLSERIKEKTLNFSNVKIMQMVLLKETKMYQFCQNIDILQLPFTNNIAKDTMDYLILINSKVEFMYDAINKNPWKSDFFAWIDFSIYHVFNNIPLCNINLHQIQHYSKKELKNDETFLLIPGCLRRITKDETHFIIGQVYWRFCGGFFFGNKKSITKLYNHQIEYFPIFLTLYNTLVWEVNFWAWLEMYTEWKPIWYQADHNDSIIQLPYDFLYTSLLQNNFVKIKTYSYPILKGKEKDDYYIPGSASYLKYNEKHLLNTRYINYTINKNDQIQNFTFHHPNKHIITKNVFSLLDDNYYPLLYQEIKDPPNENTTLLMFNGIEDIRLYQYQNEIHFIGTSMNYSKDNNNLIITGKYDIENYQLFDASIIQSPYKKQCEKNWTPIIQNINGIEKELFIYQWYPMEIGEIIEKKLEIIITYPIESSIFKTIRGSTIFIPWGEFLIGVLHFSENDFLDRKYFHILLMLDQKTMKPIKYSDPFYFGKEPGIEFCIGFTISNLEYHFWISNLDSNPMVISIPFVTIPCINNILYHCC